MLKFEEEIIKFFKDNKFSYEYDSEHHFVKSGNIGIKLIAGQSNSDLEKGNTDDSIIYLWPDQYLHKKEIIESRILSKLGKNGRIYARETEVKSVTTDELNSFLDTNHLNDGIKAKYRYGLYHNQKLVAVAAFSRSCPIQDDGNTYRSHELIRFCSLLGLTVVGGLSKLIQHFVRNINPEHIMTYVDREWSNGDSYIKLGFEVASITKPHEFWLSPIENERYYSRNLPENMSSDNLEESGWTKIHNQGNVKLVKFLK